MEKLIQLIFGAFGSVGFALIFQLNKKYLFYTFVGSFFTWLVYLMVEPCCNGIFSATLLAGFAGAIYAEIMARFLLAPSTLLFVTSVIPLIPGSTLFYCMNAIAENDLMSAGFYFRQTFLVAMGIAGGMGIAWSICDLSRKIK